MYIVHDIGRELSRPIHAWASVLQSLWTSPLNPLAVLPPVRAMAAGAELLKRATADYPKPEFDLGVREVVVHETPFCRLVHFERDVKRDDPRLLIVAPLSGHHATLLRGTVRELLPDHDIYITDWTDARTIPVSAGGFGLGDYADLLVEQLRFLGPGTHVLSVCQPAVPVLIATATLAEQDDAAQPASITLIAGPVDTRVNPSPVGQFALAHSLEALEAMVVQSVSFMHPGSGRRVYPGVMQLAGFMSLDPRRHFEAHVGLFNDILSGKTAAADKHREFYDEYFAVMDLPAEFYLETVEHVFQKHSLPRGLMLHHGQAVRLDAITKTALLTVEGEQDEITTPGQTFAAHALLSSVPADRKQHYLQPGAGHYGTFSGSRFREDIAPRLRAFIREKRD